MRYCFAGYEFDPERGLQGPHGRVPLPRLDAALLRVLLDADGRVVSKNALMDSAWQGRPVSDDSIFQSVRRLRLAMPTPAGAKIIETVYGAGIRIGVAVERIEEAPASGGATTPVAGIDLSGARECLVTAREMIGRRGLQDMVSATAAVRHALRLAPRFVEAWVLLAQISALRVNRGQIASPQIGVGRARWAARRALELSPRCDGALTVLGWITAVVDGDTTTGLAMIDEALAINDRDWLTHSLRAWALYAARRPNDGLEAFAAMMDHNALSTISIGTYGYALGCAGQFAPAFALLDQAIRRMPTIDSLLSARSSVAAMAGNPGLALQDAKRCAELAPDLPNQLQALACALAASGSQDDARALLTRMTRMRCGLAPSWHAVVLASLGDREAAAATLQRAKRERCTWLSFVQYDPRLRAIELCDEPIRAFRGSA